MILQWTYKPGNTDDSAGATTSRHTSVYLLQIAFVSPFAASRILEQRIYEPTNRRTTRPRDVKKRKVIELKFLSMLFLYYIKSRQVSIRLDTA